MAEYINDGWLTTLHERTLRLAEGAYRRACKVFGNVPDLDELKVFITWVETNYDYTKHTALLLKKTHLPVVFGESVHLLPAPAEGGECWHCDEIDCPANIHFRPGFQDNLN